MDSSILQLFTTEEILKRLHKKGATGSLHVFTTLEGAHIFFHDGMVIGAVNGPVQGEEVIKKILEWPDAKMIWEDGRGCPEGVNPVEIQIPTFLTTVRLAAKLEEQNGKKEGGKKDDTNPIVISGAMRAASTGPMTMTRSATPNTSAIPDLSSFNRAKTGVLLSGEKTQTMSEANSPSRTASLTKDSTLIPVMHHSKVIKQAHMREEDSFEEALMRKHQLALASTGDTPQMRLRIIRSSNLVGRNPACDFILNHGSISRQHCLLQITERGLHVKDLSTTNGTKVNGIKLTEGYVSVGDKLTMGHLDFIVEKDTPPEI